MNKCDCKINCPLHKAAPDLLEACELLFKESCESNIDYTEGEVAAFLAIQSARGETP